MFLLALMYGQEPYQWLTRLDLEPSPVTSRKKRSCLITLFG